MVRNPKSNIRTSRISADEFFIELAATVSLRSTCRHRWQGAVIVCDKRVISMGYNGAPPGVEDCLERGYCAKAEGLPCLASGLHGESNAIISAARIGIRVDGAIIYCVFSPCRVCCNMIKAAGIKEVVYSSVYDSPQQSTGFFSPTDVNTYLEQMGILVRKLERKAKNDDTATEEATPEVASWED